MKPTGVRFGIDDRGAPTLRVVRPARWEDELWDAVETAVASNVTASQFHKALIEAWDQALDDQKKSEIDFLTKRGET